MTDSNERPEPWKILRFFGGERKGEVSSVGPLCSDSVYEGFAYVGSDVRFLAEDEPGTFERIARLPVTEWERDRAVNVLRAIVEELDGSGERSWDGLYKQTEQHARDFLAEFDSKEVNDE